MQEEELNSIFNPITNCLHQNKISKEISTKSSNKKYKQYNITMLYSITYQKKTMTMNNEYDGHICIMETYQGMVFVYHIFFHYSRILGSSSSLLGYQALLHLCQDIRLFFIFVVHSVATTETQNQVKSCLLLDVVVGQGTCIVQLLPGEDLKFWD